MKVVYKNEWNTLFYACCIFSCYIMQLFLYISAYVCVQSLIVLYFCSKFIYSLSFSRGMTLILDSWVYFTKKEQAFVLGSCALIILYYWAQCLVLFQFHLSQLPSWSLRVSSFLVLSSHACTVSVCVSIYSVCETDVTC